MIPPDTKKCVFNRLEHIYWWRYVGKGGNKTSLITFRGLSPPPDTMTFPNFLTILT